MSFLGLKLWSACELIRIIKKNCIFVLILKPVQKCTVSNGASARQRYIERKTEKIGDFQRSMSYQKKLPMVEIVVLREANHVTGKGEIWKPGDKCN